MADFFQNGTITTLHNLDRGAGDRLERELLQYSGKTSVTLVLPALYAEFERPAMAKIVERLESTQFLGRIVVALGQASETQYLHARSFFTRFQTPVDFIQVDHPRVLALFDRLKRAGFNAGSGGKGRTCWLAYGYALGLGDCDAIVLHDCDITTYTKEMLVRLCYPVMHPDMPFEFCKGYYARCSDRLNGRVTRLFLTPLVRALRKLAPGVAFLPFLDSFRYALAGEFAMRKEFARRAALPSDWGLEVGVLGQVHKHCPANRVCQVELSDRYDHKHQELSASPGRGLRKMATEIGATLLRTIAEEGVVLNARELRNVQAAYAAEARDIIHRYSADAVLNGMIFDRQAEECAVGAFECSLREAGESFLANPYGNARMPSWARVWAVLPGFAQELMNTVRDTDSMRDGYRVQVLHPGLAGMRAATVV